MLLSMTGFGAGHSEGGGVRVAVEVRAVNNRHLKLTVRGTDPYPLYEAEFEKWVRQSVRRGTLHLTVVVKREAATPDRQIDAAVLAGYLTQVREATLAVAPEAYPMLLAGVLALPGVAVETGGSSQVPPEEFERVHAATVAALAQLDEARRVEGRAMAAELLKLHAEMVERLAAVRTHLPAVMDQYRQRLLDRLTPVLAAANVTLDAAQVVREVALYADRTDVAEELHRLDAHLGQFHELVSTGVEGAGRRLEFLAQELGREVNTLGSKAGDVTLSRQVFELKAALEKVRELIQNVE